MSSTLSTLTACAIAVAGTFASGASHAADPSPAAAKSTYQKDRAACDAGKTAEDRATCLKEAGAAAQERRRNGLTNDGTPMQNATDRCNQLPAKDKSDCLARIGGSAHANQRVTTTGSVAGGGVLRETVTTTPGSVTVITPQPMMPSPAASATH